MKNNIEKIKISQLPINISDGNYSAKYPRAEEMLTSGVPFIRVNNIKNNVIVWDDMKFISEEKHSQLLKGHLKENDVLISVRGELGKVALVSSDFEDANINAQLANLRVIDIEKIDPKYLLYALRDKSVGIQIEQNCSGSTLKQLPITKLKEIQIPIQSIESQRKIAKTLDQAQELIDKRKAQIEALDELIQSVFYDMFGDPIQNPKGFNKKAIGKEFEIKTGATPSRKDETYWDNGTIPWVKTTELKEVVIYDTDECITELGFNNSSVNLLPKNTLLIAMYGQGKTRGMTGKLGIEATTNQACAALLPTDKNNQDFIWIQLRCLYEELRNLGRGGNQPNLNTNLIKSFEILFPPIELQNQFAEIVASIQKQKELLNESLVELENNFNSLMHRAFKGELF